MSSALWSVVRIYLRPHVGRLILVALLVTTGSALSLVGPLILERFVDAMPSPGASVALAGLALTYGICAVLQQGLAVAEDYAATDLAARATNRLRFDLVDHCLRLGSGFHGRFPPGALLQRVDGDPELLGNVLSRMAVALVANALIVLGALVLLWRLDWRVGGVLVLAAAAAVFVRARAAGPVTQAWVTGRQAVADLFGDLEELLGAFLDLAGLGAGAYAERRLEVGARRQVRAYLHAVLVDSAAGAAETIFALGTTAALAVAAVLYLDHQLSLGGVFLVAAYGGLSLAPLEALSRQLRDLQPAGAAAARTYELLQTEPEVAAPIRPRALRDGAPAISVRGLSFSYEDGEEALSSVDFELPGGAVLGVVGRTGSGKSTLARLLVRMHDVSAGAIRLSGVEIQDVAFDQLRERVAYVPQELHLLAGTVYENLTLYQAIDEDLVRAALIAVGLSDWLDALPDDLSTTLGDAGGGVSAGEAQLLTLARVLVRPAALIVLDEPSARIDPVTELQLEQALDHLFAGRTGVVVAHRLETLARATHILVLEGGRAVEFGLRTALTADPGSRFAELLRAGAAEALA